ncbi:hypothetical protein MIMGU_mgv1a004446mg [Erythranthe guttata]|uniref:Uncharacterized protein n=1 Tax=Erythranthe guttata TaxID=4155 RepID=A0A022RSI9_ERYGU|nr:hypothetical protein MIMGU_mgv1a004446mg [Erythranthe guttata]
MRKKSKGILSNTRVHTHTHKRMATAAVTDDFRLPSVNYTASIWDDTFTSFSLDDRYYNHDLFTTALGFRLLRQHRQLASSSVFDKFKGEDNKFKETLKSDAKGLLSLYEAAHLRIRGEEILEEAAAFATYHLNLMLDDDDQQLLLEFPLLEEQVKRALQNPLHRGVPRIETRRFISFYEKDESRSELLLRLAKLDFNYLQNIYKKELSQLSRWWNELNLMPKLPYARSRVVESYIWATAFCFEPQYSDARLAATKTLQMLTLIDDTYDNYSTLEEADLFTHIIQRWNIDEIDDYDQIPDHMKIICEFTFSMYEEYEREAAKQGKSFAAPYAKESVKHLCRAYNKGLRWCMGGENSNMPRFEDYSVNTVITSCLYVFCSWMMPGMRHVSSKETVDWLMSDPKIIAASAKVCRFLDDLGSYQRERKEGRMLTGVDFYMKEHGISVEETADKFVELADEAWKDLNEEWIVNSGKTGRGYYRNIPKDMVEMVLNYARVAELNYRSLQDGFTKPEILAPHIATLFVDPIIM